MGKSEKTWHESFKKYMEMIVSHPNYKDLPINRKANGDLNWIATAHSEIGTKRKQWALNKAKELNIANEPGVYAKVMLEIHPTKKKICQTCGKELSLYYIYPNSVFIKCLNKDFGVIVDNITSIDEIVEMLVKTHGEEKIKNYLIKKFNISEENNLNLKHIIEICEYKCRSGKSKLLGPGAMSNFPDRFDGFHTYNRCCRSVEDTGRHAENLKTYTKDRRAYEYWSDGNIHAANKYMGSSYFSGNSADHLGPISLGFIHDPLVLRKMTNRDNSSKRDQLLYNDIEEIIKIENKHSISCMSWYSRKIWEFIKLNYKSHINKIEDYRITLKTNMANFMYILKFIKNNSKKGEEFLIDSFLKEKLEYFKYDYTFGKLGIILTKKLRNITEATKKEEERFYRIAINSIDEYNEKENRNIKVMLPNNITDDLNKICNDIDSNSFKQAKNDLILLINLVQNYLISDLEQGE